MDRKKLGLIVVSLPVLTFHITGIRAEHKATMKEGVADRISVDQVIRE